MKKKHKNSTAYMEGFYDGIAWQKAMQASVDKYYFTDAVGRQSTFNSLVEAIKGKRKK